MMPGMSGLDFCRAFRMRPQDGYVYFILLTSKSEKNDVAEGLDAGADDFLTKPVNPAELRARIAAGDRIIGMQREVQEKNRVISDTLGQLRTALDRIDKDLMQAKKIQESLVPHLDAGYDASHVSLLLKPCGHIGGDLVGMFSPGAGHVGFYSIDVSGHGITSAMMTARLGGYLSPIHFDENVGLERHSTEAFRLRNPAEVAGILNSRLMVDSGIEEYFTMVYAVANLATGVVKMVQAGHPHPLLIRRSGEMEFIGEGGVPIGLLPDIPFTQIEVTLDPGDRLLLYSDGFTECVMADGEMLDETGLTRLVEATGRDRSGREFLDDLFWRLTEGMAPGGTLEDDVSATLFEFNRP
jgi:sigma-B regulation protein RsbU (phosphoserine phosphatase)